MLETRKTWLAIAGVALFALLPVGAFLVLAGLAFTWWYPVAVLGLSVLVIAGVRRSGTVGRAFGTTGWDPNDYTQWPRYFLLRPTIVSLPASAGVISAILITLAMGTSTTVGLVVAFACGIAGFPIGALLWVWIEGHQAGSRDSQPPPQEK